MQEWFTEEERALMLARGAERPDDTVTPPIARLFQPDGPGVWLLSELDPDNPDRAYGLCDLGFGAPELGDFSLEELAKMRGPLGLPVERDRAFRPRFVLDELARLAVIAGRIVG